MWGKMDRNREVERRIPADDTGGRVPLPEQAKTDVANMPFLSEVGAVQGSWRSSYWVRMLTTGAEENVFGMVMLLFERAGVI